jgi:hypothetical protein
VTGDGLAREGCYLRTEYNNLRRCVALETFLYTRGRRFLVILSRVHNYQQVREIESPHSITLPAFHLLMLLGFVIAEAQISNEVTPKEGSEWNLEGSLKRLKCLKLAWLRLSYGMESIKNYLPIQVKVGRGRSWRQAKRHQRHRTLPQDSPCL